MAGPTRLSCAKKSAEVNAFPAPTHLWYANTHPRVLPGSAGVAILGVGVGCSRPGRAAGDQGTDRDRGRDAVMGCESGRAAVPVVQAAEHGLDDDIIGGRRVASLPEQEVLDDQAGAGADAGPEQGQQVAEPVGVAGWRRGGARWPSPSFPPPPLPSRSRRRHAAGSRKAREGTRGRLGAPCGGCALSHGWRRMRGVQRGAPRGQPCKAGFRPVSTPCSQSDHRLSRGRLLVYQRLVNQ